MVELCSVGMRYLDDGRPAASSGLHGLDSTRDRPVDLEISMGSLGCGDLVFELKAQFDRVSPGQMVRVVSDDPGAPTEIPSWCRLTGHSLQAQDPPFYLIKARSDRSAHNQG